MHSLATKIVSAIRRRPLHVAGVIGLIALGAVGLSYAEAQQRAMPGADPKPLPPEFYSVYDCRGEVALITYYWDRLPHRPGGGRLDPAVLRPLTQAFQGGNLPECHARVIEVRRYMGLL